MKYPFWICFFLVLLGGGISFAQTQEPEGGKDLLAHSLEDLLNMPVDVASRVPKSRRTSPGVISTITREEIANSGARDLIDVLRLIPGIEFGVDILGTVGIGFRGNWGHEGKVLLIVDGHEMNELMYSNTEFGNHYFVDQIEQIDVIRGPGSAIYGGFAELAVIRITTRLEAEKENGDASLLSSWSRHGYARQTLQATTGARLGEDVFIGFSGGLGYARRSDQPYTDIYGGTFDMYESSEMKSSNINIRFRWKDLIAKLLYDDYVMESKDGYDALLPASVDNRFRSYNASLSNTWNVNPRFSITPEYKFKAHQPWQLPDIPTANVTRYDPTAYQHLGALKMDWTPLENFHVLLGGEYRHDFAEYGNSADWVFKNGDDDIGFGSFSVFGESNWENSLFDLTTGIRFDWHEEFGSMFAPRVGLTKAWKKFHGKALYSRAFRSPSIEQINFGSNIRREKTDVFEVEVGWTPTAHLFFVANYFDIRIKDPIVYAFDSSTGEDSYLNLGKMGSRGTEFEFRMREKWGSLSLNYSYYHSAYTSTHAYSPPSGGSRYVGFPSHKWTFSGSWELFENLTLHPSIIVISERPAYQTVSAGTGTSEISELDPEAVVNLFIRYRSAFLKGLNIGLGFYDLFNVGHAFVQPYDGYHSPLPGSAREVALKIEYSL